MKKHVEFGDNLRMYGAVLQRYINEGGQFEPDDAHDDFMMCLAAADGENGNDQIDWPKLIKADHFTFFHDVIGIYKGLDRATGELRDGFLPRCALGSAA